MAGHHRGWGRPARRRRRGQADRTLLDALSAIEPTSSVCSCDTGRASPRTARSSTPIRYDLRNTGRRLGRQEREHLVVANTWFQTNAIVFAGERERPGRERGGRVNRRAPVHAVPFGSRVRA
jgi:hypothetical protein